MAHIHEKIDFSVSVYIVNEDAVLLHLHKTGWWLPVGGHIELNEDPNQAALRELKEESGLDVELIGDRSYFDKDKYEKELIPPRFMNRHYIKLGEPHEHVDLTYFAKAKNRWVHSEEKLEYRWFTKKDLEEGNLLPRVRFYARTALEELGSKK
ncbi:hypothetical protein A2118_00515 [Candidatus Kaiserbacteria bacterium GWA2_50_9]|uniref:Nudix hydrolase domain-containing protein n=1 Tax=Candidatus Kaiserbacteria bacterium GWA2_50_9 TaxID=1798474 RepID=A0A1F6BVA8_9BACT|nr:MAG: hypothetical protein A2118_00515 [Candidatus Kaiserbacteria bacterium GWA2_50_9]